MNNYIQKNFGVSNKIFLEAIMKSPSAQGYIAGAISEVLLKSYLGDKGFEVVRIKEKPSGGNNAKSYEARGDFYIRKRKSKNDKWLVIESKGLKSNSEFRGGKLDSPDKVYRFLKNRIFNKTKTKKTTYEKGLKTYLKAKKKWQKSNRGKKFPDFKWDKRYPGPESYNLGGIWKNEEDLKKWVFSLDKKYFTEEFYRRVVGSIVILESHQPSKRIGRLTNLDQAAPLVNDFNIMSVDLFLRTGRHEFVFINSKKISHSPTSPEHLYQNYIIDILVKGKKDKISISHPWYDDIDKCIDDTKPVYRKLDKSQIDNR